MSSVISLDAMVGKTVVYEAEGSTPVMGVLRKHDRRGWYYVEDGEKKTPLFWHDDVEIDGDRIINIS